MCCSSFFHCVLRGARRLPGALLALPLVFATVPTICTADDDLIESLVQGRKAWLEALEFKAEYRFTDRIADTQEEAMAGQGRVVARSRGELVKGKTNTLYSCTVEEDQHEIPQFNSFTGVFGNEINGYYRPGDSADTPDPVLYTAPKLSTDYLLPLSGARAPRLDVLSYAEGAMWGLPGYRGPDAGSRLVFSHSVTQVDPNTIVLTRKNENEHEQSVTEARFDLRHSQPLLVEYNHTATFRSDRPTYTFHMVAEDIVAFPGGVYAPKKLRSVQGPLGDALGEVNRGKWRQATWELTRLSPNPPVAADFAFKIHPDTSIPGLHKFLGDKIRRGNRVFDVNALTVRDLNHSPGIYQPPQSIPAAVKAIIAMVVIAVGLFLGRHFFRQRQFGR